MELQIHPGISAIREAQRFLAKYFAPTRLIPAPFLSKKVGKNVCLKLETELPAGSFKVRGAFYALSQRMKKGAVREMVASSTGNHGAAAAYAAKEFGIAAKIFLPTRCNPVKRDRIAALGVERMNFPLIAHTLPPSASIDGLLGLDFLRGCRLTVDFRTGRITLRRLNWQRSTRSGRMCIS